VPFIAVAGLPFQIKATHKVAINLFDFGQCQRSFLSNACCSDCKIEIEPQCRKEEMFNKRMF
jgi:hypothetical protein